MPFGGDTARGVALTGAVFRREPAAAWFACAATLAPAFWAIAATDVPLILASLGGSSIILFGMPENAMARPRSLLGGHLVCSVVGLAFLHAVGDGPVAMAAATATGLALMMATRTIHSPAGGDVLAIYAAHASWRFLIDPLGLGVLILLIGGTAYRRLRTWRHPARILYREGPS